MIDMSALSELKQLQLLIVDLNKEKAQMKL